MMGMARMMGLASSDVILTVDWRPYLPAVKNQAQCGDCYAFSAVAAIEGLTNISTGNTYAPVSLSEQQIASCSGQSNAAPNYGYDAGCAGGLPEDAFEFVVQNGGVASSSDYPYASSNQVTTAAQVASVKAPACSTQAVRSTVSLSGWTQVVLGNFATLEDALLDAVKRQPVSVCIDASTLYSYSSGVIMAGSSDCTQVSGATTDGCTCGTSIDHAVCVVGYGSTSDGVDFWLVRNSWGSSWGMQGYFLVERGTNACAIASQASFPTGATLLTS